MPRIISPPRNQLDRLRQPLTEGEMEVFEFFDKMLRESWEIYIQPHMNGLRPDVVLLHPQVGIAVFEVKDWVLDGRLEFTVQEEQTGVVLKAKDLRDGKSWRAPVNPVEQAMNYRREILDLYCPTSRRPLGITVWRWFQAGSFLPAPRVRKPGNC